MKWLTLSLFGALLSWAIYSIAPFVSRTITVFGLFRRYPEGTTTTDETLQAIPDTTHCEDLHYHAPSGTLFTACEDNLEGRHKWFPPLANFDDPEVGSKGLGSIHVIDPKTMKSQRLKFDNFNGPFITHGIDVIPDKDRPEGEAVYIFAVNHVPEVQASGAKGPSARSQLEVFYHIIGTSSVKHLRSIWHPLIRTPNDVVALSPTSLYVTNDHFYREHGIMRTIEDMYIKSDWSDIVHIQLDSLKAPSADAGVTARIALAGLHNTNGIGHGRTEDEILISSCTSGVLNIAQVPSDPSTGNLTVVEAIEIDHIADNPSYFADPYASAVDDRSGFLEAGVSRAADLLHTMRDPNAKDPVMVTYLRPKRPEEGGGWEKRVLLDDDGARLRSASAAVLVAIDPASEPNGGSRKAWLFATGFLSKNVIAVKVDL